VISGFSHLDRKLTATSPANEVASTAAGNRGLLLARPL
jgi:hypothetical protein